MRTSQKHPIARSFVSAVLALTVIAGCGVGDNDSATVAPDPSAPLDTDLVSSMPDIDDTKSTSAAAPAPAPASTATTNDLSLDESSTAPETTTASTTTASTTVVDIGDDAYDLPKIPYPPVQPEPPLAPVPSFDPVALMAVEGDAPPPPAPVAPTPVHLVGGPIGDLTSNAVGCLSQCISSSTVTAAQFDPSATIAVTTNVATRLTLWMSTEQIVQSPGGVPHFPTSIPPVAKKNIAVKSWTAEVNGLQADTTYRAILQATDRWGNHRFVTGTIRTAKNAPVDLIAGSGCAYQCITMGVIQLRPRFDAVDVAVATSAPAQLSVYVSTSEPGWIGDAPVLPESALIAPQSALDTTWSLPASGLDADTVYHVIARAEDAEGNVAHRVGQFRTAPEPPTRMVITIERIYLTYDGDPGQVNRGDVEFTWGILDDRFGYREVERMNDGEEFVPPGAIARVVDVAPGATIPRFGVTVSEYDTDGLWGNDCSNPVRFGDILEYSDPCDRRVNAAFSAPMTVDDLAELQRCAVYGFIEGEDDACILLSSHPANDDYAQIMVLASIELI
jgi:hypothetical protein